MTTAAAATSIFVAGGTGYLGRAVCPLLVARGHRVRLLVRPGSERRAVAGCELVSGDETLLLLVGTPHPAPWKAAQFEAVDFAAGRAAAEAVAARPARHVVYLSVAHPAPSMHAYWHVRERVEALLAATATPATFLRPWYVLGPGHRWPVVLAPLYALAEWVPASRATARRLGLVTLHQMCAAIVRAVEEPPATGTRIVEVPAIRTATQGA